MLCAQGFTLSPTRNAVWRRASEPVGRSLHGKKTDRAVRPVSIQFCIAACSRLAQTVGMNRMNDEFVSRDSYCPSQQTRIEAAVARFRGVVIKATVWSLT